MNEYDSGGFRSGFAALVGRPNVGKSTLLNRILGQKIAITSPKPQTTRNRILGIHHMPQAQILFLDTPGVHRSFGNKLNRYMVEQALSALDEVDVVLLLVEADRPAELEPQIRRSLETAKKPVLLVLNKIDRVAPPELLLLIDDWQKLYSFAEIVPVSALTGENVDRLVSVVTGYLPEGPPLYPEDMVTDLPERFLVAEMVREQVLKKLQQEIPYGVAVRVESFEEEPDRDLVVIHAVIHVERDSHKRIVVGKGGAMIREIGRNARRDIERLLGTRVFLQLFVRVDRNWTQSDRLLREFGYE
ncbi:GTP-binding protein Era [Geothermobacter ehrlichii]|uniref:GTPase Era n=1 Tax=Geothermobacter ehrlichii TaxID=213224 RepID=A0A5D3WNL9_9BACT|nr:GTPase Era [Geothermobacter ehrlichii]TYP00125.1 GTP-binding protein Era [Geothermobacter ehrlichii]